MGKRILILLCAVVMLLSCVSGFAGVDTNSTTETETIPLTPEQEMLIALNIIEPNAYGAVDNAETVTRADFAAICGKILGISPSAVADSVYFTDVTPDSWFAYTVNTLTEKGVISQADDYLFEPDRIITRTEAAKMLLAIMGFNTFAAEKGGYPQGYMLAASRVGLFDGVETQDELNNGMMAGMLYNALRGHVMEVVIKEEGNEYIENRDATLLSIYKNIHITTGIVQSVYGMQLDDEEEVANGTAIIGGIRYNVGKVLIRDYFGYHIEIYYKTEKDGSRTLQHVVPMNTQELRILSDDYLNFSGVGGTLEYISKDSSKSAKIDSMASVLRNDTVVTENVRDAFKIQNTGEYRLIDANNDGKYETILIYDFDTIVVNSFNADKRVITDKIDTSKKIDFSNTDYVNIFSEYGNELDFEAIVKDVIIDVAISDNHITLFVNVESFSGTIDALYTEDKEININGMNYKYLQASYDKCHMRVGYSGSFKTNRYGKIAYFVLGETSSLPGYIIDVAEIGMFGEQVLIKMLTASGTIEEIAVENRFKKDGDTIESNRYSSVLSAKDSVVLYVLNPEGKISQIDTATVGATESNSLVLEMVNGTHRWNATTRLFDRDVFCRADATVFKLPIVGTQNVDESMYGVMALSAIPDNQEMTAETYRLQDDYESNVIVVHASKYVKSEIEGLMFISDVIEGMNAQGENIFILEGYLKGAKTTFAMDYDYMMSIEERLRPAKGDAIRTARDANGVIGEISIIYDHSEPDGHPGGYIEPLTLYDGWGTGKPNPYDSFNEYWYNTFKGFQNKFRPGLGLATKVQGDVLRWEFWGNGATDAARVTNSVPIIVWDAERDIFTAGSLEDIKTRETYLGDESIVIASFYYGTVNGLYIINNSPVH